MCPHAASVGATASISEATPQAQRTRTSSATCPLPLLCCACASQPQTAATGLLPRGPCRTGKASLALVRPLLPTATPYRCPALHKTGAPSNLGQLWDKKCEGKGPQSVDGMCRLLLGGRWLGRDTDEPQGAKRVGDGRCHAAA